MKEKSPAKRLLALALAFIMVLGMMPQNVFAEVEPANWVDDAKTARYWPIPHQGRLVKVSSADPLKNPSVEYVGTYTRPDGREVVRLSFSVYAGATTAVWEKLIIKPDAELANMIDWSLSGMGKGRPTQSTTFHDTDRLNNEFVGFDKISDAQSGSGNTYSVDMTENGTQAVKTVLIGPWGQESPIDLVLKEGQSVKNLINNPLIQARLMDKEYERIYSTTTAEAEAVPYSSYTFSTFIPVRVNLGEGTLMTDVVRNYENIFKSASATMRYNEEEGYIDVYSKRTHGTIGAFADSGGSFNATDGRNRGFYAFRQSFDASFKNILKPQGESKVVAQVFVANPDDTITYPDETGKTAKADRRLDISEDGVFLKDGIGYIQVADNKWPTDYRIDVSATITDPNKAFLPTGAELTGYGYSTVVRYFIDKDKLREKFGSSDLVAYEFFSTLLVSNETGVEEFKSVPRDEDIDLKRGDKITLRFDGRRDLITLGTFDTQGSYIQIGDDQFAIDIRTTADKAKYTGSLGANYMKVMEVTVPFDIKIKKDTPVTVYSRKTKLQEVSPGMTVTFNYSAQDDSGNPVKKDKIYRFERPLVDGYTRNEKGEIFKDGIKINKPQDNLFIDNHDPIVRPKQTTHAGGILTKTVDVPDIDELFTDSPYLTGRSKYDRVNVYVYKGTHTITDEENNEIIIVKEEDRIGTIKASDQKIKINVNGNEVQGYQWASQKELDETEGADNSDYVDPSKWAQKDTGLYFTNQDVLQGALENDTPVVEQIQAKVVFDLNGGSLDKTVKSYEGIDPAKLPGTEFAYLYERSEETQNLVRIAPLNKKIRGEEGYTESGFTGDNVSNKDHNGFELQDDPLELRKFPTEEPTLSSSEYEFLGWTTQKITGNATNDFAKLEKATKVEEVNSGKNYIFTDVTPFDKGITVYAAYGKKPAKIVLHRNMNDQDTVVEEILLSQNNFDGGVVNIPEVYYDQTNKGEIEKFNADNFQEDFLKENTFVGWMLPNQENNGYIENKSYKAGALLINNGYTQDEIDNKQVAYSNLSETKALPNTFDLKLDKTYDEIIELGGEIHLYASYRPFYTVKLKKQFKKYNEADGRYEDLTTEELKKAHDVKFGLLFRTAVTNWNDPTVLQAANYYTLNPANLKDQEILKEWKKSEDNQLEWTVPGYDIHGQRISYIGVEVPIGQEANYTKHSNAEDWSTLGINVYVRIPEEGKPTVQDPNAPQDPINPTVKLSKSQSVSFTNPDDTVDAFTAATSRKPLGVDTEGQKDEKLTAEQISQIEGYEITVTNIPVDVEAPIFKGNIYDGETDFGIYSPNDKGIDKIKLTYTSGEYTTSVEAEITPDGITGATPGGKPAFEIVEDEEGNYVITVSNENWKFKAGDKITAQYFKGVAESKITPIEVQPKLEANKIKEIAQVPFKEIKDDSGHGTGDYDTSKVQIEVVIPNPTPDAPGNGSTFTPGIVDESGNFTPIEGVAPIVVDTNVRPGDKVTVDIPRDKLNHGDTIAFKSEEPRKTTVTPDGKDTGFGYLVVDLEGPKVNKSELKDDYFRMFADLTAELDELPEEGRVKIIVGNDEQTFETKDKAIEYLRAVERSVTADNMPEVKIIVLDASNNKTETKVEYKREEQIDIWLMDVIAGDEVIRVRTEVGAKLTVRVMRDGVQVASAEVDAATADINSISLWDNTAATPAKFKLQESDIIIIEATKDGARANPLVYFVQ